MNDSLKVLFGEAWSIVPHLDNHIDLIYFLGTCVIDETSIPVIPH